MEQTPQSHSPESIPLLRYPEGWREILDEPDAIDYQTWMNDLTKLTHQRLHETGTKVEWAKDRMAITARWQQAIELLVDVVIDPEELDTMSQAEIVETALLTMQANIVEGMGWDEEGLAFTVLNMFTNQGASIDLQQLPGETPNN